MFIVPTLFIRPSNFILYAFFTYFFPFPYALSLKPLFCPTSHDPHDICFHITYKKNGLFDGLMIHIVVYENLGAML